MTSWEEQRDKEYQDYMEAYEAFDPREDCCEEHAIGEAPEGFWDWYIRQEG
jgi:hypothetical protein